MEIGQLIDATHGDIHTALDDMADTQRSVASGVAASRTVAQDMSGIQGRIAEVVAGIHDIADSTREQSVATTEMARASEQANRATIETDQAVQGAIKPSASCTSCRPICKPWWPSSGCKPAACVAQARSRLHRLGLVLRLSLLRRLFTQGSTA